jgi:hypothetical protein
VLDLARAYLGAHSKVKVAPYAAPDLVSNVVATCGVGLEHLAGEQLVAAGDVAEGRLPYVVLLSDRRVAGRAQERLFDVPLAEIAHVEVRRAVLSGGALWLHGAGRVHDASMPGLSEPLGALIATLCQTPPHARVPVPVPPCAPGPEDPTGAAGALRALDRPAPRVETLLRLVEARARAGRLAPEAGADLCWRLMLFYRAAYGGRGMTDGRWLSPLTAADLAQAFVWILGAPLRDAWEAGGRALDFSLARSGQSGANAAAAVSSAVGLLALAFVGVGWVSVPGRGVPAMVRVLLRDIPGASRFLLLAPTGRPLHLEAPGMVQGIHDALAKAELMLLVRRCVWGWEPPPAELVARPAAEVMAALREALPGVDLAPLAAHLQ